jgi:hypothetical protein
MSFKRLEADDFVVSADSISSTLWSNGGATLQTFFTSSTQESSTSGDYYLNVYNTGSSLSGSAVQFAIAYGNTYGSGSQVFNLVVDGKSPSSTVFGQWQDLVIGDENTNFTFGPVTQSQFFAISFDRARYKESLFPGSLTLKLSGSAGVITLTDNSQYVTSITYTEAGRVFQLISGSAGTKTTNNGTTSDGYSAKSGSYGWLLPDIGTIILNPVALAEPQISGGIAFNYSGSSTVPGTGSAVPGVTPMSSLYKAISGSTAASFTINSQETITSDYIFIRPRSSEFNYSENPSFISGSTGEVLYSNFINNPQVYITTVGLYNDTNELLAVAKLSRPLVKDFTKEALVRVKLDF